MTTLGCLVACCFLTFLCIADGLKCYRGGRAKLFDNENFFYNNVTEMECKNETQFCLQGNFSGKISNLFQGKF